MQPCRDRLRFRSSVTQYGIPEGLLAFLGEIWLNTARA